MNHTLGVTDVALGIIVGIKQFQLGTESIKSPLFQTLKHTGTRIGIYRGHVVYALAYRVNIEHGTTTKHSHVLLAELLVQNSQSFGFITGGAVIIGQAQSAHKVMTHPRLLLRCRGSRPNWQIAVKLP